MTYAMKVEAIFMGAKMPKKLREKFYDQVVRAAGMKPSATTLEYIKAYKQKRYQLHFKFDTTEAARELRAKLQAAGFDTHLTQPLPFIKKPAPAAAPDPAPAQAEGEKSWMRLELRSK